MALPWAGGRRAYVCVSVYGQESLTKLRGFNEARLRSAGAEGAPDIFLLILCKCTRGGRGLTHSHCNTMNPTNPRPSPRPPLM